VHMNCGQRSLAHWVVSAFCHELSRSSQAQLFQPKLTIALTFRALTFRALTFRALTFCGHMIFSEDRFPLFKIML
jgi:hypothetical protein